MPADLKITGNLSAVLTNIIGLYALIISIGFGMIYLVDEKSGI